MQSAAEPSAQQCSPAEDPPSAREKSGQSFFASLRKSVSSGLAPIPEEETNLQLQKKEAPVQQEEEKKQEDDHTFLEPKPKPNLRERRRSIPDLDLQPKAIEATREVNKNISFCC